MFVNIFLNIKSVLPYSLRTNVRPYKSVRTLRTNVQKRTSRRTSKRTVRTLLSVQRVKRVHFIEKHLLR
jgi:hypothetical protein